MKYVFYADIFFITNFIMDFMVLKLAGLIRKKKIHTTSYLFGSFFGAAVLTLSVICPVDLGIAGEIAVYLVVSYLMCMITFGRTGWKENIQSWLAMYGMAVCIGGIMNMAYFRFRLNLVTFLVLAGISYAVISTGVRIVQIKRQKTGTLDDIMEVVLRNKGRTETVLALFDSGNSLSEPISKAPVHIIDLQTAENILGKGGTKEKIRIIPYHSLGKSNGVMTAFECDEMELTVKGNKIKLGPAYLGIYRGELSAGGKYRMILNRSINKWL